MSITRIQNNQITDSTIVAYAKLQAGSLTGNLFAPTVTLNSNVTINGNLFLANSGNTTTINATNTYINDPLVVFNNGYSGSLTGYDIGMLINRNQTSLASYGSVNTAWVWVENDQAFEAIATSDTGTGSTSINNSGYANIKVGNSTITGSQTISGVLTVSGTTNFATITTGGLQAVAIGNVTPGTGVFTVANITNTTNNTGAGTGAFQVAGGAYIAGNLWVGGNINATTQAVAANNGVFYGNAAGFGALFDGIQSGYLVEPQASLQSTANFNGYAGVLNGQNINGGSLASTDIYLSPNNGTYNDTYLDLGIGSSTYNYPGYSLIKPNDAYLFNWGNATTGGGNLILGTGYVNDIVFAVQGINTNNEVMRITNANVVAIKSTVASSNTTSGALTVAGGAGIAGAAYIGGLLNVAGAATHSSTTNLVGATTFSTATGGGIQSLAIGNVTPGTGAFTTLSATSLTLAALNGTIIGNVTPAAATFTTVSTGGLQAVAIGNVTPGTGNFTTMTTGGLQAVAIGNVTAGTGAFTTLTASGVTQVTNATQATSSSTGALQVTGGVGIGANLYVGGNTTIAGNLTVNGTLTYLNTTTTTVTGSEVVAGTLLANSGTASTNTTSGALQVLGGAGITGNIFTGANISVGGNTPGIVTTPGSNSNLIIDPDGTGNVYISANTFINYGSTSTSTTTGALIISGGTGMLGNLWVGAGLQAPAIGNVAPGTGNFTTLTATTVNAATIGNIGANVVGTGTYLTNLTGTNVNGTVPAANIAFYSGVTNNTSGGTYYPMMSGQSTTGNVQAQVNGSLSYVPNTGTLSATAFNGSGTSYIQTLQVNGQLSASGAIIAGSGVATTNNSTGALQVTGGTAITGNINIGGQMFVGPSAQATTLTSAIAVKRGTSTSGAGVQYTQDALINGTNTGSSDFIAYGNNYPGPSNDHGWTDMGFTGDGFNDPVYSITKSNDGYLFASAANNTVGGNLVLSTDWTGSYNDIVIGIGAFSANAEVARFHGNASTSGYFQLELPTQNTLTANTGAMRVWGGASISGNTYIGGAAVINGSQTSGYDFKVNGVNSGNLLWVRPNSTYDTVIIGNTLPVSSIVNGAKLQINSTDSMLLPVGTSAQRPGASGLGTDTTGMFRYSTTLNGIEYYNGSAWQGVTSSFTVIADQQFNGTGSQTIFTLSTSQTTASVIVSINGVVQIPTLAYSVSGTTLTFTEAPASGDVIDVRSLTTTQSVTNITSTNGYNSFYVDNNGAYITTGAGAQTLQYTFNPAGAIVTNSPNVTVSTSGVATTVDSFYANTYSSAKYLITSTIQNTGIREITEVLVLTDGSSSYSTSYGFVRTAGNSLTALSTSMTGNIVNLQATTTNNNTILRIKRDYQAI